MEHNVLRVLAENLRFRKNICLEIEDDTLYVYPAGENGFAVWLKELNSHYRVGFNGWYMDFPDLEAAVACFKYGLCGECELQESQWGNRTYRWTVINHRPDEQEVCSSISNRFIPFWRKHQERVLKNRFFQ